MVSVGEFLREQRTNKNFSLEEIANITKIREKYISAIEEGDFTVFSAPAYLKGFLMSYAKVLDLEPKEVLRLYRKTVGEETKIEKFPLVENISSGEISRSLKKNRLQTRWIILGLSIIVLLGVILSQIISNGNKEGIEQAGIYGIETEKLEQERSSPVEKEKPPVNPDMNVLQVEAVEETWIKVDSEGIAEDLILRQGESKIWESEDEFKVNIGNAAGIIVTFNSVVYDSLGKRGQVIRNRIFK